MTCRARVNTSLYIACFSFFFPPNRLINSFRASRVILPIFTSTFAFRSFITVCVCFCLLSVHGVSRGVRVRLTCWNGALFFSPLFPSCLEAGKERYCVRTCLCEAFPNSLRNLSANKASFFWLMSRQSVQQCYTHYTQMAGWWGALSRSARSELVHTVLHGSHSYRRFLFACASVRF